jgi:2-hydroxy-3-keto-5-methylthiopentenyl-1-phosphate phosphatase
LKTKVALIYDFDKTLSPDDMQAYGYMEKLGIEAEEFWKICNEFTVKNQVDNILTYMYMMIKKYNEKGIKLTRDFLVESGKSVELYEGVETWFKRINEFGESIGLEVEHYVVSSGLKEIIEGTSISKFFKEIYAGYFVYDEENRPIWPALAINYTNKTQFIYRINKGILNVTDNRVNDRMPHEDRPVPFKNMIYIGDSATDIPCMRLISKSGGYSVGVYKKGERNENFLKGLLNDGRVDFIAPAVYSEGSDLETIVKEIIKTIKCKSTLKEINQNLRSI